MQATTILQLLTSAIISAKNAGDAILNVYNSDFAIYYKEDKSPVTLADKRSHIIVTNYLKETNIKINGDPIPILSEEGSVIPFKERKNWSHFWLIDPLDGTKEFMKRNGEFTVNIALIDKDTPLLGVIYLPVLDVMYFAFHKRGAYKLENCKALIDNVILYDSLDKIIKKSVKLSMRSISNNSADITVIGSRSHTSKEFEEFIAGIKAQYESVNCISVGSSIKFCLVAEGQAHIYPRYSPSMEWDTAAGHAIIKESGGEVIDLKTHLPLKYNKESLLNYWFIVQ